jgi:nitroreductase/NAD-dependent dihydropyrimidine dehydrogenase PreA subunit
MIVIDQSRCDACGTCGRICPRYVPETLPRAGGDGKITQVCEARRHLCIDCGQCAAVCQHDAIRVDGLAPEQLVPIAPHGIGGDALLALLEQRRSVRRYKDKPVPREVLDRIVAAAHRAPPAAGKACVGVIVIDKKEKLRELATHAYALYAKLQAGLKNPIARYFIKRRAGARKIDQVQGFVMPAFEWYARWYREGKGDEIQRDAPVVMLFHAPVTAPSGDESCMIAALHAVLMAETLGVGTLVNGLIPPACNNSPAARALLALPPEREVFASLCLGYGKYPYRKAIRRRLVEVRYLE